MNAYIVLWQVAFLCYLFETGGLELWYFQKK